MIPRPLRRAALLVLLALFTGHLAPLAAQARPIDGDRVAKIYDLGDLLVRREPTGPELELRAAPAAAGQRRATRPAEEQLGLEVNRTAAGGAGPAAIARLAAAFAQPALRDNESIQPLGERWLVVLGRPEQHAWLDRFLTAARREQPLLITMSCGLYTLPEVAFQRDVRPALQPDAPDGGDGEVPTTTVLAPGEATDTFLAGLRDHDDLTEVTMPSLTVRPLEPARARVVNQTAYVRDFEVEIRDGAAIADPIVDVVQDGVTVQAAATPLDGGALGVSLELTVADLQQPIPTFETRIGVGTAPVTIQLPQVLMRRVEAAVELGHGHTVVLVLPAMAGTRYLATIAVSSEPMEGR